MSGRVAVITGASRGLGAGLALHLSSKGWRVVLAARDREGLDAVAKSCSQGSFLVTDVGRPDSVVEFAEFVAASTDRVDLLVNNAGVLGPLGLPAPTRFDSVLATVGCNISGPLMMCASIVPLMTEGGAVIMLSGGGVGGNGIAAGTPAYAASKFAIVGLTESLAPELAQRRVSINAIAPGAVDTNFNDSILEAGPGIGDLYTQTVGQRSRPAPMEPFFSLVEFVADPAQRWLTGTLLSARWDTPQSLLDRRAVIEHGSFLRLRRIDGEMYDTIS
jgi:NAD(P)-dependent dehydrogenase (short-subunit alcohol dehydrogenase family)